MVDKYGVPYAMKSMIMIGLSFGTNGVWSEAQWSDGLQAIITKHRAHLDGLPVYHADVEIESEYEHNLESEKNNEGDVDDIDLRKKEQLHQSCIINVHF